MLANSKRAWLLAVFGSAVAPFGCDGSSVKIKPRLLEILGNGSGPVGPQRPRPFKISPSLPVDKAEQLESDLLKEEGPSLHATTDESRQVAEASRHLGPRRKSTAS